MVSKYKETEIGSIPEEWDVTSLSDAFQNLEAGVSVNSDERQNADFFVLKTSAISDGLINIDEAKPVVKKEYARLKCPVKKGSIIISRMNTPQLVGACGYVAEDAKGYFLPDRLWQVINSKPEKYDFRWLNYLLNQYRYKNAIHAVATGTSNSMKNISKERLLEIRIPRPSIEEQKFIVKAISDIEALIYDLEKLIKKKQNIFTGTMAKNQFIRARVAGWEKDCIRRKADAAHMTESEFVRRAAMDREVTVIEGMDELLRELRYQGNNLNQLTVMARQGRITQVNYEPFTEVYRNAWQTLNSLLSHAV